jgi:hypothetical protein
MSLELETLQHVIQASITPALLLTAVAATLAVLSTRLGRIVDRMRGLDLRILGFYDGPPIPEQRRAHMRHELGVLLRRRWLIDGAILCCTLSALIVCLLIAVAFAGYIWRADVGTVVAVLFIAAMLAFVVAFSLFLWEVLFAASKMRRETG